MEFTLNVKKALHGAVALAILIGALLLLRLVGSTMFAGLADGLEHLVHMIVFAFTALFVIGTNLYIILFTPVQAIILPYSDFLMAHEKRWAAYFANAEGNSKEPSYAECHTALGYNINSGLRILAFLVAQAIVATPL